MQIYKGLDVGTAKVTPEETHGIPHHGVDILEPDAPFSVADFTAMAGRLEQEIAGRGHLPILVGGTGLYVQSFLYGVRFTEEKHRPVCGSSWQKSWPRRAVPPFTPSCSRWTRKRRLSSTPTIRCGCCGRWNITAPPAKAQRAEGGIPAAGTPLPQPDLRAGFPDRAALYRRIDLRVDKMLDAGLLAEAELVWNNRSRFRTAAQAIGYKEFFRILSRRPRWKPARTSSSRPPATTPSGS